MNKLQNAVRKAVSIVEMCPELKEAGLQLSDKQELLLTAIATFLRYECWEPDRSIKSVIKVLKTLDYDKDNRNIESTFDFLFEDLRNPEVIHPALVCYDAFISHLPVKEKLELRDSCLGLLGKYVAEGVC